MLALNATAAGWFLIAALPICFFAAFSDLRRMKIPNLAVDTLAICFVLIGFFVLPFNVFLWQLALFPMALLAGFILNAAGVMGAGDAKLIAAGAPYVAYPDLPYIVPLFAACLLGGFATHRIVRATPPLRNLVPHWESWDAGKRFPMGFPIGMTLVFYLVIALRYGI